MLQDLNHTKCNIAAMSLQLPVLELIFKRLELLYKEDPLNRQNSKIIRVYDLVNLSEIY